jgi:hypothetical protein
MDSVESTPPAWKSFVRRFTNMGSVQYTVDLDTSVIFTYLGARCVEIKCLRKILGGKKELGFTFFVLILWDSSCTVNLTVRKYNLIDVYSFAEEHEEI